MSPAASASVLEAPGQLHSAAVKVNHHPMQHFYQLWQETQKQNCAAICVLLMADASGAEKQHVMAIRSLTAHGILLLPVSRESCRPALQAGQPYQLLFHNHRYPQPMRILADVTQVKLPSYQHPWQQQWSEPAQTEGLLFDPLQLEMPYHSGQHETVRYVKSKRQWLMINS